MNLEERTFETPCVYALVISDPNLFIQAKQNRYLLLILFIFNVT